MPAFDIFLFCNLITMLASGLTAWRMRRNGLSRRYPMLAAYLIFLVPFYAMPILINTRGKAYFYSWIVTTPLNWVCEILVVSELCRAVLGHYRGIGTLGRWIMYGGMVVATSISLLILQVHIPSTMSSRSRAVAVIIGMSRGLHLALTIFLLLMLFVVSRFPLRLNRNVIISTAIFAGFFVSNTIGALLRTMFDLKLGWGMDAFLAATASICSVLWLVFLTPAGEKIEPHILGLSPDFEKRMLGRLDTLNRTLVGSLVADR